MSQLQILDVYKKWEKKTTEKLTYLNYSLIKRVINTTITN